MAAKFRNGGQTCVCPNRVFVHEAVHDRFAALLVARVAALQVGPASDPASIQHVYDFFSDAITKDPGLWWAVDLLPDMTKSG